MSTELTWQTTSTNLEGTLQIAEQIGRRLRGGEVIELISDLGGGKTAFVRGLAAGMGSKDGVRSPSFTLSNEYKAGDLVMYHFDFYRLHEPGIMQEELAELLADPKAVVAVEWADIVEQVLPANRLRVAIKPISEDAREFTFTYPQELIYLVEETHNS